MPIAAIPTYLGIDFKDASPGMRFGMYLKLWGMNRRSQELLWTTHDVGFEVRGQNQQEREVKYENKVSALSEAKKLNDNDQQNMRGLLARQLQVFDVTAPQGAALRLDALATAPFTTGLGNEHPLENGFAFLNPYGLPYLPGSGIKGVLRQAARELTSGDWGETHGWSTSLLLSPASGTARDLSDVFGQPSRLAGSFIRGAGGEGVTMLDALFGRESNNGDIDHLRGALSFWDVIPQIAGDSLAVEIMTPHQSHYYQQKAQAGSTSPHESGQPTPISFLTVPAKSRFVFHVQCNLAHLNRIAPELAENERWKTLLEGAFQHAYRWLGFGAKTAVGYGAMQENPEARAERERQAAAAQDEAQRLADEARRANLSPDDQAWEDHEPVVAGFKKHFETASKTTYKPGGQFDNQRNDFMKIALEWTDAKSRQAAGQLIKATLTKTWGTPGNKDSKQRLNDAAALLDPEQA